MKAVSLDGGVESIKKPRRMKAVCLDTDEEGVQLDDYLEKIHDNIYLSVANFCGEYLIHIQKYYLKDGCLRPKTEGCVFSINQFAIFRDILHDLEERSWTLEQGMPVVEYENLAGPWRVTVNAFEKCRHTQIRRSKNTSRRPEQEHLVFAEFIPISSSRDKQSSVEVPVVDVCSGGLQKPAHTLGRM